MNLSDSVKTCLLENFNSCSKAVNSCSSYTKQSVQACKKACVTDSSQTSSNQTMPSQTSKASETAENDMENISVNNSFSTNAINNNSNTTEVTAENVKCFYTNADQLRNKLDELNLTLYLLRKCYQNSY